MIEPRALTNKKRFIIDVGLNGFNGYYQNGENLELFAASSSLSTFARLMSDIIENVTGFKVSFKIVEEKNAGQVS